MLDSSLECVVLYSCPIVVTAFFRTRNIHTLNSPVYFWVFGGFVMFGASFSERGIFTHLLRLFIYVSLIISVHGCFTAVTIRHEPSRIVAAPANLATRLGSSRSVNFFRGRCTLPEVHFRYPFSRHDFRCDGRDSR